MASAISILLIAIFSFSSPDFVAYAQNDTLRQGQLLRDDEQLISAGGIFRLGFFSADSNAELIGAGAGARYLGIWFEHVPFGWPTETPPVPDSSGGLTICKDGKLKITHQGGPPIVINSDVESPESSGDNITATLLGLR
uniref:Bulb-type lectin domain-containing protein n=1 Tax=Salix viminalis TaxID=40686 RepID=A0A6N2KW19_SALVM